MTKCVVPILIDRSTRSVTKLLQNADHFRDFAWTFNDSAADGTKAWNFLQIGETLGVVRIVERVN